MTAMSVTFERRLSPMDTISGTHMSSKGMQTMTSTGIPSMDQLLGGGFAMNSITLLGIDITIEDMY